MELDLEKTSQLQDGAKALDVLNDELDVLVEEHDYWQIVDLEIRHFKVILK